MLAKKIQNQYKKLRIKIVTNRKDPDKRDYFVSNKKIEKSVVYLVPTVHRLRHKSIVRRVRQQWPVPDQSA